MLAKSCTEALNETWDCSLPNGTEGFEDMRDNARAVTRVLKRTQQFLNHASQLVDRWPQFDGDEDVSGADLVEWFGQYRKATKKLLQSASQEKTEKPI